MYSKRMLLDTFKSVGTKTVNKTHLLTESILLKYEINITLGSVRLLSKLKKREKAKSPP